jgi:hypothetical protein
MARKKPTVEQIISKLREAEVQPGQGSTPICRHPSGIQVLSRPTAGNHEDIFYYVVSHPRISSYPWSRSSMLQ